ncbi:MAG: hypothetical protein ACK55Z_35900, partial [bacterium]
DSLTILVEIVSDARRKHADEKVVSANTVKALLDDETRPKIIEQAERKLRSSLLEPTDMHYTMQSNMNTAQFAVRSMLPDCHSLFRAVALSMSQATDFFVTRNQWVSNSAINELRDATANFLMLQATQCNPFT